MRREPRGEAGHTGGTGGTGGRACQVKRRKRDLAPCRRAVGGTERDNLAAGLNAEPAAMPGAERANPADEPFRRDIDPACRWLRHAQTLKPSARSCSRPSSVIFSGPQGGSQTQLILKSLTSPSSATWV